MTRPTVFLTLLGYLICSAALAGETITAQEIEYYFYDDGKMKRSEGQFEITYYIEGDIVTTTKIYDLNTKKSVPDGTVYTIQRQLFSDPSIGGKIIRAIGSPGLDAVEILTIGDTYIQSVKSTTDYFVISRLKRMDSGT